MLNAASTLRVFLVACLMFIAPLALAQDTPPAAGMEWQKAITGQIEALRRGDGVAALSFAGASFQDGYQDPDRFLSDISRMGYKPIFESLAHSFGEFRQQQETTVQQVVKLTAPDQSLYEAIYVMESEPEGWRVQGVLLRQRPGVAI